MNAEPTLIGVVGLKFMQAGLLRLHDLCGSELQAYPAHKANRRNAGLTFRDLSQFAGLT